MRKVAQKSKLKVKAWAMFSKYIRLKYSSHGFVVCYTCDNSYEIKKIHAGHGIGGRTNAVLFMEDIVRPQCLTDDSSLRLFNGTYKNIKDIKKGDILWGFNEKNFKKEVSIVEETNSFVPNELYEVEMEDGKKFYATSDHKVVANGEWIAIEDMLHNVTEYDILEI